LEKEVELGNGVLAIGNGGIGEGDGIGIPDDTKSVVTETGGDVVQTVPHLDTTDSYGMVLEMDLACGEKVAVLVLVLIVNDISSGNNDGFYHVFID
jgi:hypothetical protein